jgi:hypothetical protein
MGCYFQAKKQITFLSFFVFFYVNIPKNPLHMTNAHLQSTEGGRSALIMRSNIFDHPISTTIASQICYQYNESV